MVQFLKGHSITESYARVDSRKLSEKELSIFVKRVAAAIPDGVLRFSPHWPNALAEVPRVLDAIDEATRQLAR